MNWERERLGEVLQRAGLIDESTLESALAVQAREGGKLGEVLVKQLVLTEEQIARALAQQKGLDYVDLTTFPVDRDVAGILPERVVRMRSMLPIAIRDDVLLLAMSDPLDIEAADDVEMRTHHTVLPVVASASQISFAIDKYVTSADAVEELASSTPESAEVLIPDQADDVPVVRLVNQIIRDSVRDGASDIHFEPGERSLRVRERIDGVLHDVADLPSSATAGVLSRLKVMADMDIAERRRPQDGRIGLEVDKQAVDLRAVVLPTHWGESMILRILNNDVSVHRLDDIGMGSQDLITLTRLLRKPWGAVLVSGPTGSGKTTTLYAALSRVNDEGRKIISVEDPVEYLLPGVTQVAVNPRIGVTFANGLRTILRSDPDIVMVGEVRDPETAEIAVRAALTGHLVLTSIHTNDAPSAITRLLDMGVPSYILASSILGVVAQRLVRVLCPACKAPHNVPTERLIAAGFLPEEAETVMIFRPEGCDRCRRTGYQGRLGVFEVMANDQEITKLALLGAPVEDIRRAAVTAGMRTLRRDALDKVASGLTSLEEIDRVVM
ncbi:MAG: Flp pilus assembly complex ATPase component TadA [Coriobacteriales bacterium]|nr:Flp pilus assembly complex ATPase component TadA [Coriobacteriales bacterium]